MVNAGVAVRSVSQAGEMGMGSLNEDRDRGTWDYGSGTQAETRRYISVDDLRGKVVIDMTSGVKLGTLEDIAIDTRNVSIAALVMSGHAGTRGDTTDMLVVRAWGKDAIMVDKVNNQHQTRKRQYDRSQWVNVRGHVKGLPVVSGDGTNIGEVDDILVGPKGTLAGLSVAQIRLQNTINNAPKPGLIFIDANFIQTLGPEVVLLKSDTEHAARAPDGECHAINPNDAVDDREDPLTSGGVRHCPSPSGPQEADTGV